jgi:hypothetical protein
MEDNKVAILLEDLRAQFYLFEKGLQLLNDKVDTGFQDVKTEIDSIKSELTSVKYTNSQEHRQIIQAIQDLNTEIKRLDTEVIQIKRVK